MQRINRFYALSGMPGCIGAVDGTLIPMLTPTRDAAQCFGCEAHEFYCYKRMMALLMMAIVDAEGMFLWIRADCPGSQGDAGVWRHTQLRVDIEAGGTGIKVPVTDTDGKLHAIEPWIAADSHSL
jgi:hypothetical protein